MTMRSPRPVCACQPASALAAAFRSALGKLHRGEHGERVLHEVDARRADTVAHGLAKDVGLHL